MSLLDTNRKGHRTRIFNRSPCRRGGRGGREKGMRKHRIFTGLLALCTAVVLALGTGFAPASVVEAKKKAKKAVNYVSQLSTTDYAYEAEYGGYMMHYIIVTNNSKATLTVESNTTALGEGGAVLGAGSGSIDVIGPGQTSIIPEYYDSVSLDQVSSFQTTLSAKPVKYYSDVLYGLVGQVSDLGDKVVLTVGNAGTDPAEYVEGYVLFFNNGSLVYADDQYFTDTDEELKPGATMSEQYDYYYDVPYDSVQFYLTGRHSTYTY